ncbi:hypothetical protein BKA61DRAFT_575458 [Leptodontidium sp. MPI-SDFR-AT-0119]|nr:hypothetical protein BKA61DRAFT_575458 [Leptodontidium sp. MPI-SDFR-AT-0119]
MAPTIQVPAARINILENVLEKRTVANRVLKEREKQMLSGEDYQRMEQSLFVIILPWLGSRGPIGGYWEGNQKEVGTAVGYKPVSHKPVDYKPGDLQVSWSTVLRPQFFSHAWFDHKA